MNKKKIICSVLAAQLSFNFFVGNIVVRADINSNEDKKIIREYNNKIAEELDVANLEEEELCDSVQAFNSVNSEIVWGLDSNYKWSNNKCKINSVRFKLNSDETTVSIYDCDDKKSGSIALPNKIRVEGKDYAVTSIKEYSFLDCRNLNSIVIPNSVASIEDGAFINCAKLSSITIPDSVIEIGSEVFVNCGSLNSIIIPDGVTDIGEYLFCDCESLSNIAIPESVTSIGSYSFCGCKNLNSIILPSNVEYIGEGAFDGCKNLKSIWALEYQYNKLKDIFSGDSLPVLIESNLYNRKDYKDDLIKIKADCVNALNLNSNEEISLSKDEEEYFIHDPSNISMGDSGYKYIAEVNGNTYESPVIYVSVKDESIDENIVWGEESSYRWNDNECIINDIIFELNSDKTTVSICAFNNKDIDKVLLPYKIKVENNYYSVIAIKKKAFSKCSKLITIDIPQSVINIGDQAFYNCTSLKAINIPSKVQSIGYETFYNCKKLQDISFPEGLTRIEGSAFENCNSLSNIVFPESLECLALKCFRNCTNLDNINIPEAVDDIGYCAFENCSSLSNIIIPSKVRMIGFNTFAYCTNLQNIELPNRIEKIDNSAFQNCVSLEDIELPDSINEVGNSAFSNCCSIEKIIIPSNLKDISSSAFSGCSSLKDVCILNGVKSMGENAFANCFNLEKIVIPNSLDNIALNAMDNTANLKIECSNQNSYNFLKERFYNVEFIK